MTRGEIAKSIRELGELMERFHDEPDELERLGQRLDFRARQMRRMVLEARIDESQETAA